MPFTPDEKEAIKELFEAGNSVEEIRGLLNIKSPALWQFCHRTLTGIRNEDPQEKKRKREKQYAELIKLFNDGFAQIDIARKLDSSPGYVASVIKSQNLEITDDIIQKRKERYKGRKGKIGHFLGKYRDRIEVATTPPKDLCKPREEDDETEFNPFEKQSIDTDIISCCFCHHVLSFNKKDVWFTCEKCQTSQKVVRKASPRWFAHQGKRLAE